MESALKRCPDVLVKVEFCARDLKHYDKNQLIINSLCAFNWERFYPLTNVQVAWDFFMPIISSHVYRNNLEELIDDTKSDYFKMLFKRYQNDSKHVWKVVKVITGGKSDASISSGELCLP